MRKAVYLLLLCSLAACEKAKQDMYDQPKYKPFRRSELFADGNSSRPLPENGVLYSKGPFAGTSSGRGMRQAWPRSSVRSGRRLTMM